MAKKKEVQKESVFDEIAKATGGQVAGSLKNAKYFVDTGSLSLNFCCSGRFIGGGIPAGRLTEIYGPSSSGKSLFATNTLAGCQRLGGYSIYLDCENAINPEWIAKASKVDVNRLIRYTPQSLEEAFLKVYNVIRAVRAKDKDVPLLFVYDSISASPCKRELSEIDLPDDFTEADFKKIVKRNEQPGERAKIISKELRKLTPMLEEHNVTAVIINQVRVGNFGSYTGPSEVTPGGKALEFYASLRFRTQGKKRIDNKKLGTIVGVNTQIKNTKNRSFAPFRIADGVKLLFESGINPVSGLLTTLIQAERIEPKGAAGTYVVKADWLPDGKESVSFKAKKDDNEVPMEVLLECPKLLDGKTTQDILDYLKPFGDFQKDFANLDLSQTAMEEEGGAPEDIMEKLGIETVEEES